MKITTRLGKNTLEYDTDTGFFIWLDCCTKPFKNGQRAEHQTRNGYLYIKANQKQNSASRLAYALVYNTQPEELEIDHINRKKDDNRPENLRLVTRIQQLRNRRFKRNTCGVTGVSIHKKSGLFRARYRNKTTYHKTLEEADWSYKSMFAGYAQLPKKFNHGKE